MKLKNGGVGFEVMSRDDVETFARKKSKAYSNGPWKTDFDEMAKKTVLKKVLKYAPLKTEFARAVASDESVKTMNRRTCWTHPMRFTPSTMNRTSPKRLPRAWIPKPGR